jgi:hypothetical protein
MPARIRIAVDLRRSPRDSGSIIALWWNSTIERRTYPAKGATHIAGSYRVSLLSNRRPSEPGSAVPRSAASRWPGSRSHPPPIPHLYTWRNRSVIRTSYLCCNVPLSPVVTEAAAVWPSVHANGGFRFAQRFSIHEREYAQYQLHIRSITFQHVYEENNVEA